MCLEFQVLGRWVLGDVLRDVLRDDGGGTFCMRRTTLNARSEREREGGGGGGGEREREI